MRLYSVWTVALLCVLCQCTYNQSNCASSITMVLVCNTTFIRTSCVCVYSTINFEGFKFREWQYYWLSRILFSRKSDSTGTPIINFCFRDFNFREWYQDSRNSWNLNPTKIMPYTVYTCCLLSERMCNKIISTSQTMYTWYGPLYTVRSR